MDKNNINPNEFDANKMDIWTRQLEASVHLLEYLYGILYTYKQKGVTLYSMAYLIDLICAHLMHFYGGDISKIKEIKEEAKKELDTYKEQEQRDGSTEIEKVTKELKDLGINFKVLYDPKMKKAYPNIDISKFVTKEMIDDWMLKNMDKVLDNYLEKKKQKESKNDSM